MALEHEPGLSSDPDWIGRARAWLEEVDERFRGLGKIVSGPGPDHPETVRQSFVSLVHKRDTLEIKVQRLQVEGPRRRTLAETAEAHRDALEAAATLARKLLANGKT